MSQATKAVKKTLYFVIPNEVRNLSLVYAQEKRDSSARSAPRNDRNLSFPQDVQSVGTVLERSKDAKLKLVLPKPAALPESLRLAF